LFFGGQTTRKTQERGKKNVKLFCLGRRKRGGEKKKGFFFSKMKNKCGAILTNEKTVKLSK